MTPFEEIWDPPPVCDIHFTPMPMRPPFQGAPAIRTCACGRSFLPGAEYGYGYLQSDPKRFEPEPDQTFCKDCKQPMYVYAKDDAGVLLYRCPAAHSRQSK